MTNNEIIKALECCKKDDCDNCPNDFGNCYANLSGYALDLINHQQAEIEKLERTISYLESVCESIPDKVRTEAIKEFWSKLKKHSRKMQSSDFSGEFWDRAVLVEDGDNLVKEHEKGGMQE